MCPGIFLLVLPSLFLETTHPHVDIARLLLKDPVSRTLDLTQMQRKTLAQIDAKNEGLVLLAHHQFAHRLKDKELAERRALYEDYQNEKKQHTLKANEKAVKVLSPHQLAQLLAHLGSRSRKGIYNYANPEIAKHLGMSRERAKALEDKIKHLNDQLDKNVKSLEDSIDRERRLALEKIESLLDQNDKKKYRAYILENVATEK